MIDLENWQQIFCPNATPLEKIDSYKDVDLYIKRDDLNHKIIQGNKLRKLKYNIKHILNSDYNCIATFGGAWSNHIVATAKAAYLSGVKSIGFIRGDELENQQNKWSDTLLTAAKFGMEFLFLTRKEYRRKETGATVQKILSTSIDKIVLIPEGGSNKLALQGVAEIIKELKNQSSQPTHIISACGTGGTIAGLIDGVAEHGWDTKVIGIPVLKGADFLNDDINKLSKFSKKVNWQLFCDYHGGGYGKTNRDIIEFAKDFTLDTGINLDKVYTSKSFFAAYDLIKIAEIAPQSKVVILHTGGLQGGII